MKLSHGLSHAECGKCVRKSKAVSHCMRLVRVTFCFLHKLLLSGESCSDFAAEQARVAGRQIDAWWPLSEFFWSTEENNSSLERPKFFW